MGDRSKGLTNKYRVERVDGKPLKGGYCIVLEVGDPNAWPALLKWADTVEADGYRILAADVRNEVRVAQDDERRACCTVCGESISTMSTEDGPVLVHDVIRGDSQPHEPILGVSSDLP